MILNQQQLYQYANQAGFSGLAADIIVAIAQAESGGNTAAANLSDPFGGSYGVLQINGSHIIGFGGSAISLQCAYDPGCAFSYAFGLSGSGKNFTPWSTYTNNTYKQFLRTSPVAGTPTGTGSGGVLTNPLTGTGTSAAATSDPLGAISSFFTGIQSAVAWIANPTRILKVLGGMLCLAGAIWLMVTPEAASVANRLVKTGKKIL